jgi:outer membrane protein OmpA-like peptidoglycan-associated protein
MSNREITTALAETRTLNIRRLLVAIFVLTLFAVYSSGCAWSNKAQGAVIGAGAGGAAGAAVGNATGSTVRGAIIGAAIGGTAGAVIGHQMDQQAGELAANVPDAHVQRIGEGIAVTFPDGVLFPFDSDRLHSAARENMRSFAASLRQYPNTTALVVGHTDSVGTDVYNQALSERRAVATADFLVMHGVDRSRITTAGRGEGEPIATNVTDLGRSQNRRVEVAIYNASQ